MQSYLSVSDHLLAENLKISMKEQKRDENELVTRLAGIIVTITFI